MMTFLGLLMVVMVSGDNEATVIGNVGQSVLLPCPCVDSNLNEDIKWQKIFPAMLVVKFNNTGQHVGASYTDRANMTLTKGNSDCSVLLANISEDDHGEYKCIFYQNEAYTYKHVHLHVCGTSKISQRNFTMGNGETVFQCDLKDCYGDLEIQWTLNGTLIENSSMNISRNLHEVSPDLNHFSTTLSTKVNLTSKPECIRKIAPNNSVPQEGQPIAQIDYYRVQFKAIPVLLVLGLSLILCFLRKSHKVMTEDVEENRRLELVCTNCNELRNQSPFI